MYDVLPGEGRESRLALEVTPHPESDTPTAFMPHENSDSMPVLAPSGEKTSNGDEFRA